MCFGVLMSMWVSNVAAAVLSPQELARKAANPAFAASLARAAAAQGVRA